MDTRAQTEETPSMEKEAQPEPEKVENPEISEHVSSKASLHDSEYESVESGDIYSEDEENRHRHSGDSGHSGSESGSVILEREEGDGQESIPTRKVDDDQDKKNPQYIPKRGTFYEHDDRTADDIENSEAAEAEKAEKEGKKKVWQDKKEKWSHDKFNDNEQAPKSRAELVSIYGYDIRNEDGPPRARRRRRYGRGPNKYTRSWEDEDAYSKPAPKKRGPKKPIRGGRSSIGEVDEQIGQPEPRKEDTNNKYPPSTPRPQPVRTEPPEQYSPPSRSDNIYTQESTSAKSTSSPQVERYNNKNQTRIGTGRIIKQRTEIKEADYRGFTKPRQFRSSKSEPQNPPPRSDRRPDKPERREYVHSQNYSNKNPNQGMQDIEKDMGKLNVSDQNNYKSKHNGANNSRQNSVPPRLQGEQKGSKRYSSIRQRSLPETANPPLTLPHPPYYSNDYAQQAQATQQSIMQHQGTPMHAAAQMPQIAPPPLPTIPQVPVTATPILQAAPQFASPFPQPAPFLQPAVAPPPFLPQQTPQLINYVPSQPQYPQPPYPEYQQQFNPVTQPAELFTPSPGITYYNPQQQASQRPVPQKRPKAAIPIVAPPPLEPRGRGRATQAEMASPNGSIEIPPPPQLETNPPPPPQVEDAASFEDATVTAQE